MSSFARCERVKIKFDSNQDFQLSGINAVLDIFEGQPLAQGAFEWQPDIWSGELLSELGVRNVLTLTDETLFTNVCKIQQQNGIVPVASLQGAQLFCRDGDRYGKNLRLSPHDL